jgi:glyoxylase-like metal-dependent hydrolase (beta-lactamase superfamily II)
MSNYNTKTPDTEWTGFEIEADFGEISMSNALFRSRPICTNTWLIQGDGCNSYLVVGETYGMVIDTGFAIENIQAYAQTLVDKPVKIAANTHGHFDHTGGNGWFACAYMSTEALEIAKIPYPSLDATKYSTDYEVIMVGDGDAIDLGTRVLEVIKIPAHAPSSIALLDKKQRILFTGDEVDDIVMLVWMQDEPQPTVEQHARNMEKLLARRTEFDFICAGHEQVMGAASLLEDYLENDRRIMAGIEGAQMVLRDDGPADFHMHQIEFKRTSIYKGTTICW